MMNRSNARPLSGALALSLGLALAACGGMPSNRTVYSVKQPVVERTTMALDVTTSGDSLSVSEQRRVAAWFEAMDLRYGDRVSVQDPNQGAETQAAVADLAGRYGLLLTDAPPLAASDLQPGQARIAIQRSRASVPGCPDWTESSDATLSNGVSSGYGCAANSNLAAMIADPEELIKGRQGSNDTYINTSNSTIKAYSTAVGTKVNTASAGTGTSMSGGN